MSAGFSDMCVLKVGILFFSDWKLITRFVTSDCFRPCGAARFLGVGVDVSAGWKFLRGEGDMWFECHRSEWGESTLNLFGELWSRELLKKEELKFGRPQLIHSQDTDEFAREVQMVGLMLTHFLCIQELQVSHWMAGWFDLQGFEQTPQGYFQVWGLGLSSISPDRWSIDLDLGLMKQLS